jgi:hypothetical protein
MVFSINIGHVNIQSIADSGLRVLLARQQVLWRHYSEVDNLVCYVWGWTNRVDIYIFIVKVSSASLLRLK